MRYKDQALMEKIKSYVSDFRRCEGRTPKIRDIAAALEIGKTTVQRYLHEMAENGLLEYDGKTIRSENSGETLRSELCAAPLVGSIPCGNPMEEEENTEAYIQLPRAIIGQGEFFILRASGNSMIDAHIEDGDLVIIRKQETAQPGDIVAALIDDHESTLKRLCYDTHGNPYLHPENSEYKDIIPDCGLRIQGVAIKVIKSLGSEI